ncbi:hypothetical protein PV05_09196 [Exophiala xenobiotica]|uniref:Uncharacterized protein n=1 Tax=Exophiala xenobiotica TaxID=348802 RepID=A0A0D2EG79_9EURO|nr:uncharacterized protein PV05_09196 [Exophiala xenobiotica]KIW53645.1 hypothetical protein PV05_09196 [Exophiala xenobiotica]
MGRSVSSTTCTTFEQVIAFANCVVWLVAAYALYARWQEKKYLAEVDAAQARWAAAIERRNILMEERTRRQLALEEQEYEKDEELRKMLWERERLPDDADDLW